jgi:CheY-like chemotaxis protein
MSRLPRRVLLVDDDIAEIAAVKRVLREAGLQTVLATNASDAVAEVSRTLPEILVVAAACESGEGAALVRRLASEERTRGVPLLVLGEGVEDVAAPALPLPIDPAALTSEIAAALERGSGRAQDQAAGLRSQAPGTTSASAAPTKSAETPGPGPQPTWRNGEALQLAVEAEALRQHAESEAARSEAGADLGPLAGSLGRSPKTAECGAPELQHSREPAEGAVNGSEQALPPEILDGTTGRTPLPRLLALAFRARASGRLEFATRPARALWLEEGRVVGAASAAPGERTEAVALSAGLLTGEQQCAAALAAGELGPRSVGALLVERGLVDGGELDGLLRRRAEEVAFALFSEDAPFRFVNAEPVPPEERAAPNETLALAVEGARRRWDAARIDAALGGPPVHLAPGAHPAPVEELALSPAEARALALADGLRSVDEIALEAGVDLPALRPVLAALVEIGALRVQPGAKTEPAPARGALLDAARLAEKESQVRRADYFTILGVRRDATRAEIGQAADRLLAEFAPAAPDGVPPDARLADIRQVLEDARDVLLDDELRSAYLAALAE